ncbi:MAG: NAD(P)-dependent oxidoreductase [Betaproteobacteria bacterium]|nr:NAD(P)-dependent oxidoreductase [Betaproteobacteria bacterium]
MKQAGSQPQLGFVGLGKMGAPMARRLIERGYRVSLFDINSSVTKALAKIGGKLARSPAEVGASAEIVFTCLPSLDAIREVVLGKQGICRGKRVRTYIDLSTTGSEFARTLGAELARHGIAMLDAPVSGGVPGATNGTLALMLSGKSALFRRVRPVLEVLGKVFYVSPKPGRAQTMKLINNLLSSTGMAVACEGFVMGVKAGLDPDIMLAAINSGTGRNSATANKFPRSVLPRSFDYGANMETPYKDISLCMKEAEELGVTMLVGNTVKQLWAYGIHHGGAKQDSTRIITYLEQWAGVKVVGKAAQGRHRRRTG